MPKELQNTELRSKVLNQTLVAGILNVCDRLPDDSSQEKLKSPEVLIYKKLILENNEKLRCLKIGSKALEDILKGQSPKNISPEVYEAIYFTPEIKKKLDTLPIEKQIEINTILGKAMMDDIKSKYPVTSPVSSPLEVSSDTPSAIPMLQKEMSAFVENPVLNQEQGTPASKQQTISRLADCTLTEPSDTSKIEADNATPNKSSSPVLMRSRFENSIFYQPSSSITSAEEASAEEKSNVRKRYGIIG
jgi:hypothetical protein